MDAENIFSSGLSEVAIRRPFRGVAAGPDFAAGEREELDREREESGGEGAKTVGHSKQCTWGFLNVTKHRDLRLFTTNETSRGGYSLVRNVAKSVGPRGKS